jgi:Peptidase family M23
MGHFARFYACSIMATFFNPRFLLQLVFQAGGQLVAVVRWFFRAQGRRTRPVDLAPPCGPGWKVLRGGLTPKDSHSWNLIAQRYAYDLVKVGDEGKRYEGDGRTLVSYHAFGQPVLAPADGLVVAARDGSRDYPRPGSGSIDWRASDFRGNHVVLRHEGEIYSLVAHLRRGSVRVRPGDVVHQGERLGECGNSGHSTEPHIHFQAQDSPNFYLTIGVPVVFTAGSISYRHEGESAPPANANPTMIDERVEPMARAGLALGPRDLLASLITFIAVAAGAIAVAALEITLVVAIVRALSDAVQL